MKLKVWLNIGLRTYRYLSQKANYPGHRSAYTIRHLWPLNKLNPGVYYCVIKVLTFSACLKIIIEHINRFPWKIRVQNIPFSSFDQKDQKPSRWGKKEGKKNISGEVAACQSRNLFPLMCRDSGKRKYYQKCCSGRLASKQNLTRVKDSINHQDLLKPETRLYSPWGKQQHWGPPFCSISLRGQRRGQRTRLNFKGLPMPFEYPLRLYC